jgi:hypothetical protein
MDVVAAVPISVPGPVYDAERHPDEAVRRVLSHTFGDFEFINIHDGSECATEHLITSIVMPDFNNQSP